MNTLDILRKHTESKESVSFIADKELMFQVEKLAEMYQMSRTAFIKSAIKRQVEWIQDELEDDPNTLPRL